MVAKNTIVLNCLVFDVDGHLAHKVKMKCSKLMSDKIVRQYVADKAKHRNTYYVFKLPQCGEKTLVEVDSGRLTPFGEALLRLREKDYVIQ